jgi:GLPGLI family protein
MKKQYLGFLFLIFIGSIFSSNAQEIEGRVIYQVSTKVKSDEVKKDPKSKVDKHTRKGLTKLYKGASDVDVVLEFNQNLSVYEVIEKMSVNSQSKINFTQLMAGGDSKYYTSRSFVGTKNMVLECKVLGECFLIENKLIEWELTQETKVVGGYICYKAIQKNLKNKKKILNAWYTPQIPVSYGPLQYAGLPGLILQLEKNTIVFTAKRIELNPKKKIKIKEPSGVKKISYEEYKKMMKKSFPEFNEN